MKPEGQEEKRPVEAELRSVEARMRMKRSSRGGAVSLGRICRLAIEVKQLRFENQMSCKRTESENRRDQLRELCVLCG
jgi:hypothetical protein